MRTPLLIIFLVLSFSLHGETLLLRNISAETDLSYVTLSIESTLHPLMVEIVTCKRHHTLHRGQARIPVLFSEDDVVSNFYKLLYQNQEVGEIELFSVSSEYYQKTYGVDINPYLVIGRCTLPFAKAKPDESWSAARPSFSLEDLEDFEQALADFDPMALSTLQNGTVQEKCELLTAFIWSLDPQVRSCPGFGSLTLSQKLYGMKHRSIGMLCGDFVDLFIQLAYAAKSELKVRRVNAWRFNDPSFTNIIPNTHVLVEVLFNGKWWLFDPTYRVFFTDQENRPVSADMIREMRLSARLGELKVVHIPTKTAITNLFNDESNPFDPYNYNYFCVFNWFEYILF